MAVHDAEINIGVNLDADQFSSAYNKLINKASQDTQNHVQGIFDDMKGAATKSWQTLPYAAMHDPTIGNQVASQAFVASMAEDLRRQGLKQGTLGFQSALLSASMKSTTPNAMDRYHRMLAEGMYYQADEVYPTTALSRAIESNYALMEQDWSRDFLTTKASRGLSAAKLNKLTVADLRAQAKAQGITGISGMRKADLINALVQKSKDPTQIIDFAGMRDFAVEHGLGRWIDPEGEHTASNFELIDKELEKIGKSSDVSKKNFEGWGEALKGSLGILTAIGGALAKTVISAAGTAIAIDRVAEKETVAGAKRVDARRALVNMTALNQLETKNASRAVSLGEDAIYDEILSMSDVRQQYLRLGQGDALPASLLGIFDNLMSSDTPYEAYKSAADEIYNSLKGMPNKQDRENALMLMDKMGLGGMSMLVGQFLSNADFAKKYKSPSALFDVKGNQYYSSYSNAELLVPDLSKVNESIKASYTEMANSWTEYFGKPFRDWWDETLQNTIVPWTTKLMRRLRHQETTEDIAAQTVAGIIAGNYFSESDRLKAIAANSGRLSAAIGNYKGFFKGNVRGTGTVAGVPFEPLNAKGTTARAYWDDIEKYANMSLADVSNPEAKETLTRLKYMTSKLKGTGLSSFLTNRASEDIDTQLIRALQVGIFSAGDWQGDFDRVIDAALKGGEASESDEKMIELLRKIAENTAVAEAVANNPEFKAFIYNSYSASTAAAMESVLQR